jgi:hypothetical protein
MKIQALIDRYNIRLLLLVIAAVVTFTNYNHFRWQLKTVIVADVAIYYSYLPAVFYEHDLTLSFLDDTVNRSVEQQIWFPGFTREGKPVIKTSMGMAISYLPFFALAHMYATLFDYPLNGICEPYQFAVLFSSLAYFLLGLYFLWKVLIRYFPVRPVMLTLFSVTFATNAFYYMVFGGGMPHVVGFCFVAVFLYYTILWHEDPKLRYALFIGAAGGFLTLTRPINFLVFIFFFLYGIQRLDDLKQKLRLLWENKAAMLLLLLCAFLVVLPQLIYWKFVTGKFFFNSYVGEHFFFNNPHILKGLIGFRKGWLIYTPIMAFSLLGFYCLRRDGPKYLVALPLFFFIYVYVAFSWWCWWYGGSFGSRVLIDIYPLLAIPLCAFFKGITTSAKNVRRLVYSLVIFFFLLNILQSAQAKWNIIHYDSMTARSYLEVFGTIEDDRSREKYLKHPDYNKALKGEDED